MVEQSKEKSEFLTARQLAEHLQVSEATVHKLRRAGRIPAVMLSNRLIRFNLREVRNALKARTEDSARQPETDQEPSPQLSFVDVYAGFTE